VGNLDPNVQAAVLGLASVWLLAALLHERFSLRNPRLLLGAPAFLLLVSAGLLTGSRGGALSLLAALLAVLCSAGGGRHALRTFLVVIAGLALLVFMAMQNEDLINRFQQSVEQGDTAGRGYIYASSWDMWMRRPFLGWGLGANEVELGGYTDTVVRDTHSIYLYALTAAGAAGGFLLGGLLMNSVRAVRRLAPGLFRQVAMAGLVFVLIFGGTVTILFFKFFWVALVVATPLPVPNSPVPPRPVFRPA
jgi:O-antigen ligase